MTEHAIVFDTVSKRYRLGLTRVSVPALVTGWLKRRLRGGGAGHNSREAFWALRDVSFTLDRGESLALVGPNGAGKTTTLKLLAKITKPSAGQIAINGQLSALIELGAGFHPDLTGRENIFLNGTILGLTRQEIARRFDEIVAFSELERFIDTPVKRYSSGMTVRLGFAVASCIQPDILLVDEVLAVGDAAFQQRCMDRIHELLRQGTSVIFVSHNLYLVQAVCKNAIYLDRGQAMAFGPTPEIINQYERTLHKQRAAKLAQRDDQTGPRGLSAIEIVKVEMVGTDDHDHNQGELLSSAPAQLQIHYQAYDDVGPVSVAAHIVRSDGLTCCQMRTKLDGVTMEVGRGTGVVTIDLDPLQLVGGAYYAEGHFLNADDYMGIATGRSDWFQVKGTGLSYEERSGVFEPRARWEHHELGTQTVPAGEMEPSTISRRDGRSSA